MKKKFSCLYTIAYEPITTIYDVLVPILNLQWQRKLKGT
jgi:hypothetical protein